MSINHTCITIPTLTRVHVSVDITNMDRTDDEIAHQIIDEVMPVFTSSTSKCIVYHDAANQPPTHCMFWDGRWISVNWFSCPCTHAIRDMMYEAMIDTPDIDSAVVERIRKISRDLTRIHHDFDRMLSCVKQRSLLVTELKQYLADGTYDKITGELKERLDNIRSINAW